MVGQFDPEVLRNAVSAAAGRGEVCAGVRLIYEQVEAEVAARRPVCAMSGRCCWFDEYGHRLFVTTAELAAFVADLRASMGVDQHVGRAVGDRCPFQAGKACQVHEIRPFGCRIFFCDPSTGAWQEEQYARFHQRLRQLHDDLGVPYFYVEWRQALAAMGQSE